MNQDSILESKNINSPKSLLPFFVYQILCNQTNKVKHLTLQQLMERLQDYPYEINVDRRALSRTINTLDLYMAGCHLTSNGAYHDNADDFWLMNRPGLWRNVA